MDFFQVISLEEALQRLRNHFPDNRLEIEEVSLLQAQNRFLAEDLSAGLHRRLQSLMAAGEMVQL